MPPCDKTPTGFYITGCGSVQNKKTYAIQETQYWSEARNAQIRKGIHKLSPKGMSLLAKGEYGLRAAENKT